MKKKYITPSFSAVELIVPLMLAQGSNTDTIPIETPGEEGARSDSKAFSGTICEEEVFENAGLFL